MLGENDGFEWIDTQYNLIKESIFSLINGCARHGIQLDNVILKILIEEWKSAKKCWINFIGK